MLEKLDQIKKEHSSLKRKLNDPKIAQDPKALAQLSREFHHLEKIARLIKNYESLKQEIQESRELLKENRDQDILSLAKEEIQALSKQLAKAEENLKIHLLPQDPQDKKNIILEIRAGAGGDEASLFAQELFSAYSSYAESQSWKIDVISVSEGNVGGYKEIIAHIAGPGAYSLLKYESGVHRVQRVPQTESQGRIHTSTVTVVVLPEADPVHININPSDLRVDVYRSSGAGGQHVNTTDSAVRVVHIPTKITAHCQQEKSQHANKEKALKILYARLLDFQAERRKKEESQKRKDQMGGGDRSQKIRTYNFPQSRLTDHRIPSAKKNLFHIMKGGFSELFEELRQLHQSQLLAEEKKGAD